MVWLAPQRTSVNLRKTYASFQSSEGHDESMNDESDNSERESKEGFEEYHHAGFRSGQNKQTLMKKGRG